MDTEPARLEIAVLRAARSVRRAFDVRLRPLGLNVTQASLLAFLADFGALTQRELADHLHIGRASVGSFVEGLEAREYICRTADPLDGRAWRVSLTEAGAAVVDVFNRIDVDLRADLRAGLSRQERHALAELLIRLDRNAVAVVEGDVVQHAP